VETIALFVAPIGVADRTIRLIRAPIGALVSPSNVFNGNIGENEIATHPIGCSQLLE